MQLTQNGILALHKSQVELVLLKACKLSAQEEQERLVHVVQGYIQG